MMDEAKIIGITPAVFTLRGILDVLPPTILRPTTFFEYCTGMRRSPSCRYTTNTTINRIIARMIIPAIPALTIFFPLRNLSYNNLKSLGIVEIILIKRIIEIPFPIPFSVICSPNHITRDAPATSAAVTMMISSTLLCIRLPPRYKPIPIARPSITAKAMVTYRVYSRIFFLPSSPSFCISSNLGIAIVISCIIMEDVMYGVIFNANTDICVNAPPVI